MPALSDEVKNKVRLALGYGMVEHGAFFEADGMTAVVDYTNRLEYMMDNIRTGAEAYILDVLGKIDKIEDEISGGALCRIKLSSTEEVNMNSDELNQLERQYLRWVMKLCDILSCKPYPRSNLFRMMQAMISGGTGRRRS